MLPTTRNTNATAATPAKSADFNAVQDCIVGMKFPSTSFYIPGAAFVIDVGAPTRSGNVWTFSATVGGSVVAALESGPWVAGTRITDILWSFNRNSTPITGEIDLSFAKRSFGDGGATGANISTGIVSGGSAWNALSTAGVGLPYTIEAGFEYLLKFLTTNLTFSATPFFDGVKIIADRL